MKLSDEQIRQVCKAIVEGVERDMGHLGVFDLLLAIDENRQWFTEIKCSRYEAEEALLNRHGAFDPDIWPKVKNSNAWQVWEQQSNKMRLRYLQMAVDECVHRDLDQQ